MRDTVPNSISRTPYWTVFFACLVSVTMFCSSLAGNMASPRLEPTQLQIVQRPIPFTALRRRLTLEYIRAHSDPVASSISITPRMIVAHWTNTPDLKSTLAMFKPETLPGSRTDIERGGRLNVSAQFVVDRDGTVYQLMPETLMARHTIGLNRVAIGIENVGGGAGLALTDAQVKADAALTRVLVSRFPTITYLIGHLEYLRFRGTRLWQERDPTYYTVKSDPGAGFMAQLRGLVADLKLKGPPVR